MQYQIVLFRQMKQQIKPIWEKIYNWKIVVVEVMIIQAEMMGTIIVTLFDPSR